jgi:hypothetical protein
VGGLNTGVLLLLCFCHFADAGENSFELSKLHCGNQLCKGTDSFAYELGRAPCLCPHVEEGIKIFRAFDAPISIGEDQGAD